jgi:hypothetical protein
MRRNKKGERRIALKVNASGVHRLAAGTPLHRPVPRTQAVKRKRWKQKKRGQY